MRVTGWPVPMRKKLKSDHRSYLVRQPCARTGLLFTYVDLGHAVGIAGEPHFRARQFRYPRQARAGLREQFIPRHPLQVGIPDAAVPSHDAVMTRDPSGLKTADTTYLS